MRSTGLHRTKTYLDNLEYRSLLEALLYHSVNTRLDIAYAVGLHSQFGTKPALATSKNYSELFTNIYLVQKF